MSNAALYYHPDGYRTDGKKLMGRQAAGEGFLRGYLAHAKVDTVYAYCPQDRFFSDFEDLCSRFDKRPAPLARRHVKPDDLQGLKTAGGLFMPGPNIDQAAWTRRRTDSTAYSLTGVTHTTASEGAMVQLAGQLTAPYEEWDAVICTSSFVRKSVDYLHEQYSAYLEERLGVSAIKPKLQLPVIPLGVFADDYDQPEAVKSGHRARLRQSLGIQDDDIVVLFVGRLSFHAKANPLPMLIAMEQLAQELAGKTRLHLIQSGWFANDAIGKAFDEAQRTFAPTVVHHLVNGREDDYRFNIWHAADIFCSLSDNIQETFGLTPIEAMAASLPVLVTDWDGYRDTVAHGQTGIRVPTILPAAEGGRLLADRYEDDRINYDVYCAESSMATAVDIPGTLEGLRALATDADLRKRMGKAGRERVQAYYDWKVVVGQYQELWRELAERRERARQDEPASARLLSSNPLRPNPFAMFADYPTYQMTPQTRLFKGNLSEDVVRQAARSQLVSLSGSGTVGPTRLGQTLFNLIAGKGEIGATIAEVTARIEPAEHDRCMTLLGWLMKVGAISTEPQNLVINPATTGPAAVAAKPENVEV